MDPQAAPGIRKDTDGEPDTAFYLAQAHRGRDREIRALFRRGLDRLRRLAGRLRPHPAGRLVHNG